MGRLLFAGVVMAGIVSAFLWAGAVGVGPVVITKETEHKVVTRFGQAVQVIDQPGFSMRLPWLDKVITLDRRMQYLNAESVEMVIARNEKLIIDYYAVWQITNPKAFIESFPGAMRGAERRIQETINAATRARIAGLELAQLLRRPETLDRLGDETSRELERDGVRIVDVRINRTELPRNAEDAAYAQMREQRRALAREYRVRGERSAREARAEAERAARMTLAEAHQFASVTRGEGDAAAARIYSDAYAKDAEFYAFVRSLEAYRKTLGTGTTLVLPPDHAFYRFLDPAGARDAAR